MSSLLTEREENRLLQEEVSRLEDEVTQHCAERDELAIKYNAISERLEQALRPGYGECGNENAKMDVAFHSLTQQNLALRKRLDVDQAGYRRKLHAFQEGQQRQAQLVVRLQAKVLQYKNRCGELEQQLLEQATQTQGVAKDEINSEEEELMAQLEEEKQRSLGLQHVNTLLREHLDRAGLVNESLTEELQELSSGWSETRKELDQHHAEWRKGEKSFNSYLSKEKGHLMKLWRNVISFHHGFNDLKSATERDLNDLRLELGRLALCMRDSCHELVKCRSGTVLEDGVHEAQKGLVQARAEAEKAELLCRVLDLSGTVESLQAQLGEKEKLISSLGNTLESMENRWAEAEAEHGATETEFLRAETEALHQALRGIAQVVVSDVDSAVIMSSPERSTDTELDSALFAPLAASSQPLSPSSLAPLQHHRRHATTPRARSPLCSVSPILGESTVSAVYAALHRRQLQVQEMRVRLSVCEEQSNMLQRRVAELEEQCQASEEALATARHDTDEAQRTLADTHSGVEVLNRKKAKLCLENTELQRLLDCIRDDLTGVQDEREHLTHELEQRHHELEQQEEKASILRRELGTTSETLQQVKLQKDLLENERNHLAESLSRAERRRAELETCLDDARSEECALQESLSRMSALNEGLAHEKDEVEKLLLQAEEERSSLRATEREAERQGCTLRAEMGQAQSELRELGSRLRVRDQLLEEAETQRQELQKDVLRLRREKEEQEEHVEQHLFQQVKCQVKSLKQLMETLQKEAAQQTSLREQVFQDKESICRKHAELGVRLTVVEREGRECSEEVTHLRCENNELESRYFACRMEMGELENRNKQLDAELQASQQASSKLHEELNAVQKENDEVQEQSKKRFAEQLATMENEGQLHLLHANAAQESAREVLESTRAEEMVAMRKEMEEQRSAIKADKDQLEIQLSNLQRKREEDLLVAKNDKEQVLYVKEAECDSMREQLHREQHELGDLKVRLEVLQTQQCAHVHHFETTIGELTAELHGVRGELKLSLSKCEEFEEQHDVLRKEVQQLQKDVKLAEKIRERLVNDLEMARHELDEGTTQEVHDSCKALEKEVQECEVLRKSNRDLRDMLRCSESERVRLKLAVEENERRVVVCEKAMAEMRQDASEVRAKLREAEQGHLNARREVQEARRQVQCLDAECCQRRDELSDLHERLAEERQHVENRHAESEAQSVRLAESDKNLLNHTKKVSDLQALLADSEERRKRLERERHTEVLEEQAAQGQQADDARDLAVRLVAAESEAGGLRGRLVEAEARLSATEAETEKLADARQELDRRVSTMLSSLQRTLGIGKNARTRSLSPPSRPGKRSTRIARSQSPPRATRLYSSSHTGLSEKVIDLEVVTGALEDFATEIRANQEERDELNERYVKLSVQLTETETRGDEILAKLEQVQLSLDESRKEKKRVDVQLENARTALLLQEEALMRSELARSKLEEKGKIHVAEIEKLEGQRQHLSEAMEAARTSGSKLEAKLQDLEIDFRDREPEMLALRRQVERLQQQVSESEERAMEFRISSETLSMQLSMTKEAEVRLKKRLEELNADLSRRSKDCARLADMERKLRSSEQGTQALQEQLMEVIHGAEKMRHEQQKLDTERVRSKMEAETRSQQQVLKQWQDREEKAQLELGEMKEELRKLQVELAQVQRELGELRRERQKLQAELFELQEERRALKERLASLHRSHVFIEGENQGLRNNIHKMEQDKQRLEEQALRLAAEREQTDRLLSACEQERSNVRQQAQRLQEQLVGMERHHAEQNKDLEAKWRREGERAAGDLHMSHDRAHRQRIRGLEEQLETLKEQLRLELRGKQAFVARSVKAGREAANLRRDLGRSLASLARRADTKAFASEARRLDASLRQAEESIDVSSALCCPVKTAQGEPLGQPAASSTPTRQARLLAARLTIMPDKGND
uniref:rootletin n=1 Tax=Myxine glutinosa TaxID=7769 RepID=UPI00358EE416